MNKYYFLSSRTTCKYYAATVTLLTGYAILKIKEHYISIQLKNCGGNNM